MPAAENRFVQNDRLRVGPWTLDPAASRLERQGEQIRLEPRLTDLLYHFARNPRRVISKEELIDAVWQGRILNDSAVARAVGELRKALGDTPHAPRYIETIPKRGYRLVADVNQERSRWIPVALIAAATLALALVFLAVTARRPTEGESETTEALGAVQGTSSEQALDAYRLGETALSGGGQIGNESAIVHLTRALELDPEFALARAGLAEAYAVRATWYGVDGDWAEAALVEASRAVALAPKLVESHKALGFALSANARFGEAEVSYRHALELRPRDKELTFRLGEILMYLGEWPEALAIFSSLGPDAVTASSLDCQVGALLVGLDYAKEARTWLEAALATEPFQVCSNIRLAQIEIMAGEFESARVRIERVSAAHAACEPCDQILGEVAFRQGRSADAASHLTRALERSVEPKSTLMRIRLANSRAIPRLC